MTKQEQVIYLEFFIIRWDECANWDEEQPLNEEYGEFLKMEGFPPMSADELQADIILNRPIDYTGWTLEQFRSDYKLLTDEREIKDFCDANIGEAAFKESGYPNQVHSYAGCYWIEEYTPGVFEVDAWQDGIEGTKEECEEFLFNRINN